MYPKVCITRLPKTEDPIHFLCSDSFRHLRLKAENDELLGQAGCWFPVGAIFKMILFRPFLGWNQKKETVKWYPTRTQVGGGSGSGIFGASAGWESLRRGVGWVLAFRTGLGFRV